MIIFGTRGITYNVKAGDFHCPSCGGKQAYRHQRVRRFFTLYFIPCIPLDQLGEYVECQACSNTYKLTVLDYDPDAGVREFEAEFHRVVKRVMALMVLADGNVDDGEIEMLRGMYKQITRLDLSEADVRAEVAAAQTDGKGVAAWVAGVVGSLNDSGKEMVLRAAFLVANADGEFADSERKLLVEIGTALQMTPAHINGVMDAVSSAA
jgi:tellurite resistance protein